jgi:hypothetical protein
MKWETFVESIEDALDKECFLPALALTLILPDICSAYEYPIIYKKKEEYNGHKGQGAAYAKWYDEYIYKYELSDFSSCDVDKHILEQAENFQKRSTLTGFNCWKLRCGLLHNGELDIDDIWSDKNNQEFVDFKFTVSQGTQCGYGGSVSVSTYSYRTDKKIEIEMDLVMFCNKILAIFKNVYLTNDDFIKKTEDKSLKFFDLRIE